jgi:hypothetical protein
MKKNQIFVKNLKKRAAGKNSRRPRRRKTAPTALYVETQNGENRPWVGPDITAGSNRLVISNNSYWYTRNITRP